MTDGLHHVPGFLGAEQIRLILEAARALVAEAPLVRPCMRDALAAALLKLGEVLGC